MDDEIIIIISTNPQRSAESPVDATTTSAQGDYVRKTFRGPDAYKKAQKFLRAWQSED